MTDRQRTQIKWVGIISTAIVAATPGVYAAWENAKQAWQARVDARVSDTQAVDLQKYVKALEAEINQVRQTCATHKDLVDLILKLQPLRNEPAARRQGEIVAGIGGGPKPAPEQPAASQAPSATFAKPRLLPPDELRQQVRQDLAE